MDTNTNTEEFEVNDLDAFRQKFSEIAARCRRHHIPEPTWRLVREESRAMEERWIGGTKFTVARRTRPVVEITVDRLRLAGGWSLLAVVEHLSPANIVRRVPGTSTEIPVEYRTASNSCDFCTHDRHRKETFVVVGDQGGFKRVGRQCLALHLGITPEAAIWSANWMPELRACGDEEEGGGFGGNRVSFSTLYFLTVAGWLIRTQGWTSQATARDLSCLSTAQVTQIYMEPAHKRPQGFEPLAAEDRDSALATRALAWIRGLELGTGLSDYEHNLRVACDSDWFPPQHSGIVASGLVAYQRHEAREAERRQQNAGVVAAYLGKPGDKLGRKLSKKDREAGAEMIPVPSARIVAMISMESQFGPSTLVKMVSDQGHVLVWKTSPGSLYVPLNGRNVQLVVGDRVQVVGTVKRTTVYRAEHQTELSRCTLTPLAAGGPLVEDLAQNPTRPA